MNEISTRNITANYNLSGLLSDFILLRDNLITLGKDKVRTFYLQHIEKRFELKFEPDKRCFVRLNGVYRHINGCNTVSFL